MTDLLKAAEKPWVKTYCGGKPNYCTPEVTPDVDAVNISAERVDETAKREHEDWYGQAQWRWGYERGWDNAWKQAEERQKREWVGLTDEEIYDYADKFLYQHGSNYGIKSFGKAIEAKLKEKNT